MILDYDKNPALSTDQKLQSLVANIQRALDEQTSELQKVKKELEELKERTE